MKHLLKSTVIILVMITMTYGCDKHEERVARYPVNLRSAPDKTAKRITWLSKAEKVKVLKVEGDFTHARLAGGKEGYIENKALAIEAIVISSDDIALKRRPSESTGDSGYAKMIHKAGVAFIVEKVKNEEGQWLKIKGGSSRNKVFPYFEGWVKEGYGYDNSSSLVQAAIELETATQKKDLEKLKSLMSKPEPVAEVAAAQVVEIEGVKEEKLDQDTEVAPETETETKNDPQSDKSDASSDNSPG